MSRVAIIQCLIELLVDQDVSELIPSACTVIYGVPEFVAGFTGLSLDVSGQTLSSSTLSSSKS